MCKCPILFVHNLFAQLLDLFGFVEFASCHKFLPCDITVFLFICSNINTAKRLVPLGTQHARLKIRAARQRVLALRLAKKSSQPDIGSHSRHRARMLMPFMQSTNSKGTVSESGCPFRTLSWPDIGRHSGRRARTLRPVEHSSAWPARVP